MPGNDALTNRNADSFPRVRQPQIDDAKSSVYMMPASIKSRFSQIPELLQQSDPFDVHRAIKPLLAGKKIKLERRFSNGGKTATYWVVGTMNIGRAVNIVEQKGHAGSVSIGMDIQIELELS